MFFGKRGQATLFVVAGIIITVLIIASVLILKYARPIESSTSFSSNVNSIRDEINTCNKEVARNGLILAGLQSGRYKNTYRPIDQVDDYYGFENFYVSHFVFARQYIEFTLDGVEKEINEYYKEKLPECLGYFSKYEEMGYTVDAGEMNVDVEFLDESTKFNLQYDVTASKADKTESISDYIPVDIELRFKKVFEVASGAARLHAVLGGVPRSFFVGTGLDLINYRVGYSTIYRILDKKDDQERRYVFYFAAA